VIALQGADRGLWPLPAPLFVVLDARIQTLIVARAAPHIFVNFQTSHSGSADRRTLRDPDTRMVTHHEG
jgi:hypothetical protein